MRELKFRFWDEKYKRWEKLGFSIYPKEDINRQGLQITQFTGLHDKNGKEIWEGDIVTNSYFDKTLNPWKVVWQEEFGAFSLLHGDLHQDRLDAKSFLKVVGNIFENPELLKS